MNVKADNSKNFFGHIHYGAKTAHGYGICDVCGSSENSDGYANPCSKIAITAIAKNQVRNIKINY